MVNNKCFGYYDISGSRISVAERDSKDMCVISEVVRGKITGRVWISIDNIPQLIDCLSKMYDYKQLQKGD